MTRTARREQIPIHAEWRATTSKGHWAKVWLSDRADNGLEIWMYKIFYKDGSCPAPRGGMWSTDWGSTYRMVSRMAKVWLWEMDGGPRPPKFKRFKTINERIANASPA